MKNSLNIGGFFSAKDVQALQYKSYLNFTPSLATYKHTINLVANFWFWASAKTFFQSPRTPWI